jgi:hypothetical protein
MERNLESIAESLQLLTRVDMRVEQRVIYGRARVRRPSVRLRACLTADLLTGLKSRMLQADLPMQPGH